MGLPDAWRARHFRRRNSEVVEFSLNSSSVKRYLHMDENLIPEIAQHYE